MITFKNDLTGTSWEEIAEIFEQVGWGTRDPNEIRCAFEKSSHVRIVYDKQRIVGFGRTVDDGMYYALIVDLVVHPNYQGRGIGKALLKALKDELSQYEFTTLTAAPGKDEFYTRQGWRRQSSSFIWPRSDLQMAQHAMHSEPDGPANGSQPIRVETNSMPSAAGSRPLT
jgi:GNAT superfamily N-acetyltransferase